MSTSFCTLLDGVICTQFVQFMIPETDILHFANLVEEG